MNKQDALLNIKRKEIISKRKELKEDERKKEEDKILEKFRNLSIFKNENLNILCFYPVRGEVDLRVIYNDFLDKGHRIYFPVVLSDLKDEPFMEFYSVSSMSSYNFIKGSYNIPEPRERADEFRYKKSDKKTVILCPGLLFDKGLNRIGYGGGYYDRFLSKNKDIFKIGVCFSFQIMDDLTEFKKENDIKMDLIING